MNREQAEKLLGALIFDDLDEQSKAQLIAYLETDEDLRESLADLRMALKVTTDAVQQGPDPVLSDTRLKRLERLSQSKGRPRVTLVLRLTAVAATIAIVTGAILIPSLNSVKRPSLSVTNHGHIRNLDLAESAASADVSGSIVTNRPSRGSGRAAVTDGENAGDGLARAGIQVADNTWQMQEAANRPFAAGLEVAKQTESLELPKSKLPLSNELGRFENSSVAVNDKFYAYSEATQPRTSQPVDGARSWHRPDEVRGEVLQKLFSSDRPGRSGGQGVDLYGMYDAKAQQELGGRIAEDSAGPVGRMTGLDRQKETASAWGYGNEALADKESEVASLSKQLRPLKRESGLGTESRWKAGRDGLEEGFSYDEAAIRKSRGLNERTGLKLDADGNSDFSETDVTGSAHGFGMEAKVVQKVPVFGDLPLVGGLFRQGDDATDILKGGGTVDSPVNAGQFGAMGGSMGGGMMGGGMGGGMRGGRMMPPESPAIRKQAVASGEASGPQQVLLQTQVIKVDEGALQALGFKKEALAEGGDMKVWSDQAGKAELDSVITKLKQKDQLSVVATPSTVAQDGKPSSVAVITEEYFMLTEGEEESTKGIQLGLTPRVEENQRITLDVDLGAMPQTRTSTVPQSGVRSNTVSLNDGDSVILINPENNRSSRGRTHEAVIVTANLLPDESAPPVARPGNASAEFTLAPASRFKQMPVNPWVLSEQDALSTFALDVDTASYALCRQYLEHGFLPPAGAVRMEEFVNAFDYAYPQRSEPTFSVMAEGAPSPFAEPGQDLSLIKIAVKARTVGRDQRKAAHLVFVVDSSASMGQADRLPLIQQGLSRLVEELGPQDRVSLVSCSDQARLLLDHVPASDRDVVVQAVHAIQPSGSTNLLAGLQLGYGAAKTHFTAGQINQVILCSDGVANVGATEAESVLEAVAADRQQGIMLMCVGVGYGAYNDVLLEALANQGDGRYVFVDGADQVERVLVQPLASALQTVAKDARIQVKFNPDVVRRYRLVGYENRDIKDEQFRDDTVDAGEVGSGQCVTALYEIELTHHYRGQGDLGTVFVRYKDTDTQAFEEIARPLTGTLIRTRTVAQSPRFYLAASAARFAEWLRQSEHARATRLDQIQTVIDQVSAALPLDRDIRELADLVRQAEGLPRAP